MPFFNKILERFIAEYTEQTKDHKGKAKEWGALTAFAKEAKISRQRLGDLMKRPKALDPVLKLLCNLRKMSGKNWAQFGKMLDDELLKEDDE